jgi:hypothetical protein
VPSDLGRSGGFLGGFVGRLRLSVFGVGGFGRLHQSRHPLLDLLVGGNADSEGFGGFSHFHRKVVDIFNLETIV